MKLPKTILPKIYEWFLDLFFLESCLGCQKKGQILCDHCTALLRHAERETDSSIIACFDYRDPSIKKAIWNLKYYHKSHISSLLGRLMYEQLLEELSDIRTLSKGQAIFVIPVPLTRTRRKMRGYNQAEKVARGFCAQTEQGIFELRNDILEKKINTLPQAKIHNRAERLKNIHGVFSIKNQDIVKGRTVIVIDDVTTTGGTLSEIIKILKKSGAKKVIGVTVAH